jgi:hypothetical protein
MNALQLIGLAVLIGAVIIAGAFALFIFISNRIEGEDVYDDEDITR